MNIWANTVMTQKGLALQTKLFEGTTLQITRAVTGTGYVTPGLLSQQTEVSGIRQELFFRPVTYPEEGKCTLSMQLNNDDLTEGYLATQVGVYAMDPDEGEILYFISQAPSADKGTEVPAAHESPGYTAEWTFYVQYGQADEVTVEVDPTHAVSFGEMESFVNVEITTKTVSREQMAEFVSKEITEKTVSEEAMTEFVAKEIGEKTVSQTAMEEFVSKEIEEKTVSQTAMEEFVSKEIEEKTISQEQMEAFVSKEITEGSVSQATMEEFVAKEIEENTISQEAMEEFVAKEIEENTVSQEQMEEFVSKEISESSVSQDAMEEFINEEFVPITSEEIDELESWDESGEGGNGGSSGGAGTLDHNLLYNRDLADQHSIQSITGLKDALDDLVPKEEGKGLSTNDFTAEAKSKLDSIEKGAQKNVQADWNATSGDAQIKNKPTIPGKTSQLTNDSKFITLEDVPKGAAASNTAPKMAGTATVGTEEAFARGDHIHPSDTSRVPVTRKVNGKALSEDITLNATDVGARPSTWTPSASDVGAAAASHDQAASTITAGTFAGQVVANGSGQTPGTSLLRNSRLVSADTNPTVNGEICWTYK